MEAELAAANRNQNRRPYGTRAWRQQRNVFDRAADSVAQPEGNRFWPLSQSASHAPQAQIGISVMPEMARLGQRGRVDIVFTVTRSGLVKDLQVVANSGYDALDKGALSAIQLSNPFQQLPAEYETDLKLRIAFLYNLNP